MLCKVSSAGKSGQAEENEEHRVHDGIAPAGFHHEKGEEQNSKVKNQGRKEKPLEQINGILFHYELHLRRIRMNSFDNLYECPGKGRSICIKFSCDSETFRIVFLLQFACICGMISVTN